MLDDRRFPKMHLDLQRLLQKLLDQPRTPKEDLTRAKLCNVSNAPESAMKVTSCPKPLNVEKPKRRLQPASSILLKNISGLDVEEENKKPKGYNPDPAAKAAAATVFASLLGADSGLKVYMGDDTKFNPPTRMSSDVEHLQSSGLRKRKQSVSRSSSAESAVLHLQSMMILIWLSFHSMLIIP